MFNDFLLTRHIVTYIQIGILSKKCVSNIGKMTKRKELNNTLGNVIERTLSPLPLVENQYFKNLVP